VSKTNEEIVRHLEEAWDSGDLNLISSLLDPTFVSHTSVGDATPNIEEFWARHQMGMQAFPDRKVSIEDLFGEGDKVVVRCRAIGTNSGGLSWLGIPPNGQTIDFQWISIYRVSHGRVIEHWAVQDTMALLTQLGLELRS
jgi:predicted ester cyclase